MVNSLDFSFGVEVEHNSGRRQLPFALAPPAVAVEQADLSNTSHVLEQEDVAVSWFENLGREFVEVKLCGFVSAVD